MTESKLIDGFADSLWNSTASDAPATKPLQESSKCDVVIIGAGFTGLNAALKLATNKVSVQVLEAGQLGIGSSGRSGGQVNLGLNLGPSDLLRKFGTKQGERLVQAVVNAPDHVFNLIRERGLNCDAVQNGWVQGAVRPGYVEAQKQLVEDYARVGVSLELLDKQEMQAKAGTCSYIGGMHCSIAGSIQPLSYTRELARTVMQLGVKIHTHSAVDQLVKTMDGWCVKTAQGQVNCTTVLVCTNAYTDNLVSGLKQSVVPVRTILIASEPLSPELRETILPGQLTFVDKRRLILYFRYDRDGRLCVGDHGPSRDLFKLSDFNNLKRRAIAVFPELSKLRWDFHWGGRVAMTKDALPFMHEIAPGLIAGMGYNGRGVAMGSMMGSLLADHVLANGGSVADELGPAFPITRPNKFLMHPFHKIGVSAAVKWFTLRDYLEEL